MPRQYSPQFRERVVALVEHGHDVRDLSIELDIAAATIYRWRRQARIDAGEIAGVNTAMASELAVNRPGFSSVIYTRMGLCRNSIRGISGNERFAW